MFHTVPAETILSMAAAVLLIILITAGALIFFKKKTKGDIMPAVIGAGTFIVFALILESILHNIVLAAAGKDTFMNMWFYAIYGGLAAGLFEETGRLLSMRFLMKKSLKKENAVMFGIGYGCTEMLLLIGINYVSYIVTAVMINTGAFEASLAGMDEALIQQTADQLSVLWTTPSYMFIVSLMERILALFLQVCLSYVVYRAVKERKPVLYGIAVLIHFLVDAGTVLLSKTVPLYAVETALAAVVVVFAVIIFRIYKFEKTETAQEAGETAPAQSEENSNE